MKVWIENLFRDSLVYGIGFGVSRFLQIIVLPIIAHALSLSEYGYYSNYIIFYTIVGGVLVLGLDNSVARFMYDSDDKIYHRKVFSICFFCVLIVSIFCVALSFFFPTPLLGLINVPRAYSGALPYVLLIIPFLVLNNFFLSWFKWRKQKFYFLTNAVGTVFFLLIPLLIIRPLHFLYIFKIIFFSQLLVAVTSTILTSSYIRIVFDRKLFWALLSYGFPWMLVFFLGLSRGYLDRFFLTRYLNQDAYGVYNFSVRLATFIALITTAFDMSFGPLAFSVWNKKEAPAFFARMQSGYTFLIAAIACAISVVSPLLILILGGAKFTGAELILPFMFFAAIPLSLINFSSLGTAYAKKSFLSTTTLFIGFSVVLILNLLLTPKYLQYGAVIASLVGHVFIISADYFFSRKYYRIPFRYAKDGAIFLFFFALSIIAVRFHFTRDLYADIALKLLLLAIIVSTIFIFLFPIEYKKSFSFLKNLCYAGIRSNARI